MKRLEPLAYLKATFTIAGEKWDIYFPARERRALIAQLRGLANELERFDKDWKRA